VAVAPGHEKAFPAGNPKVLAIVAVFPLGETALATFLSIERFNFIIPFPLLILTFLADFV
jgi:hypothetical protein